MLHAIKRSGLAAAVLAAGAMGASQAWANTAADTTIRNTVTVNYSDAASTPQAAITAQVNLVRSSPLLSAPVDQTTDSATNAVYSYTITTTANGVATYNLTSPLSQSAGISASTAERISSSLAAKSEVSSSL